MFKFYKYGRLLRCPDTLDKYSSKELRCQILRVYRQNIYVTIKTDLKKTLKLINLYTFSLIIHRNNIFNMSFENKLIFIQIIFCLALVTDKNI